jgi:hypothetical protein
VHELVGIHPEAAQDAADLRADYAAIARCGAWRGVYQLYARHDWKGAAVALADYRANYADDPLIAVYDERLKRFQAEPPPAAWDGVIRYTQK